MNDNLMALINELRSTLVKVEQVLGEVDEAIVWTDSNGRIIWCNSVFDQLIERPHIVNLGAFLAQCMPLLKRDFVSFCDQHPATFAAKPHYRGRDIYGFHKKNSVLILEIAWSSFQEKISAHEDQWSVVFVIRDITENHQAEVALRETKLLLEQQVMELQTAKEQIYLQNQQLNQANLELLQAQRLKDDFFATMSHELRTPLNGILGSSEILLEEILGSVNEEQSKAIAIIQRNGKHLLSLISDILDASKMQAGKLELVITLASVNDLCQSSLDFIQQQAAKKQIRLNTNIAPNLGNIEIDERRMRQVLAHLLNNAIKFTPSGGQVTLDVSLADPECAGLGSSTDQSAEHEVVPKKVSLYTWIVFSVTDTGMGIAQENHQKLFQPFVQIDGSLNRQYEGMGLGLALVKQIVELHNGSVSLISELGQGSCFMVRLPYPCC